MIQDVQSLTKMHFIYMFTHVDLGGIFDLISYFITYCLTIEGGEAFAGASLFNQLRQIEILKPNSRVD